MAEPESRPLPPYPTAGGSYQLDTRAWSWVQSGQASTAPDAAAPAPAEPVSAGVPTITMGADVQAGRSGGSGRTAAAPAEINATSQAA